MLIDMSKIYKFRLLYLVPGSFATYREAFFDTREELESYVRIHELVSYMITELV